MSRKPTPTIIGAIPQLRHLVIQKAGFPCSNFSEIHELQERIKEVTDETLSFQTLNRFFGLIKNDFKPSAATLNILSQFVGYESYHEFEVFAENDQHTESSSGMKLSELMKLLFNEVYPEAGNDPGFLQLGNNVSKLLSKQPSLASEIYPVMASISFGRKYFFERFINLDALNSHFGEGLLYYLLHAKKGDQAYIGYFLLAKKALLTYRHESFDRYYQKLVNTSADDTEGFEEAFAACCYAASLYRDIIDGRLAKPIGEILADLQEIQRKVHQAEGFPAAEYLAGEALILAKEYYKAWEVLRSASEALDKLSANIPSGYKTQYLLMCLFAGYYSGMLPEKHVQKKIQLIKPQCLYPLSTKYFSLFILRLQKDVCNSGEHSNANKQIDHIIEETGFVFLKTLFAEENKGFDLMEINGKKRV